MGECKPKKGRVLSFSLVMAIYSELTVNYKRYIKLNRLLISISIFCGMGLTVFLLTYMAKRIWHESI